MVIGTLLLRRGKQLTIRAIGFRDENEKRHQSPTHAFFQEQSKKNPKEFAALRALLDETAANGPPKNESDFKHLSGTEGIWEFKTWSLRLFCFKDANNWIICMNGTTKQSNKTPPADIRRAKKIKSAYDEAKKRGAIEHDKN